MFPFVINPLPILLTLTTTFGVLVHDTQIDQATSIAIALPVAVATYGVADVSLKLNDLHVHAERVSFSSRQPSTQPRSNDDKKYIVAKKYSLNSFGGEYSWPSI